MAVTVSLSWGNVTVDCATGTRRIHVYDARCVINNTNTSTAEVIIEFYITRGAANLGTVFTRTYRVGPNETEEFSTGGSKTITKNSLKSDKYLSLYKRYRINSGNWQGTTSRTLSKTKLTVSDLYARYQNTTYLIAEDITEGNTMTLPTTTQVPGATKWFTNDSYYGTGYSPGSGKIMPYNASSRYYVYAPSTTIDILYDDATDNTGIGISTLADAHGGYLSSALPIIFNGNIVISTNTALEQAITNAGWSNILIS